MRRHDLLAALGTTTSLLAGCQALGGPGETTTRTRTCETPGGRRVEVIGTGSIPSAAALSLTATVDRQRVTADETAQLRVRLTNEGDRRVVSVADALYSHLYRRGRGRSTPEGLWLYRSKETPERAGACWTRPRPPDHTRTFAAADGQDTTLATGESVTTTYEVWDDYATLGYFPTGTYRFPTSVAYWLPGADISSENPATSEEWWFELDVIAPGE